MNDALTHRQLQSLIEVSNVLNSSLDIDTIIDSIMHVTVSVIDAADGGVLFLYDRSQGYLIAKSTTGFDPKILEQVRLRPGESMTGLAFSARQCLIFEDPEEVERTTATLTPDNLRMMLTSVPTPPQSAICAPIMSKGECIGVITLDSFQPDSHFTQEDIRLLKAISHQAAVALEKAQLYREKQRAIRQLESLNYTITKQNEMLSRSVDIHGHLADLVLSGEGLSSIVRYLNEIFRCQTLLFDEVGELVELACHRSISENALTSIKQIAVAPVDAAKNCSVVEVDGSSFHLVSLPLGSKPTQLGFMAVLSVEPMDEIDLSALEHACTVIALELVKAQAISETQQRLKGEFIEGLFSGKVDEALIQQARHLKLDPNRNYLAMIIQCRHHVEDMQRVNRRRKLMELVNRIFIERFPHSLVVSKQDQIIILLSFSTAKSTASYTRQLTDFAHQFHWEIADMGWGQDVKIALGRAKSGLIHVGKSAQEAQKGLQFLKSYSINKNVISYSELGVQRLLLQNSEEELLDFIQETIGPLLEYESHRKGDLLSTLLEYLERNQNGKETAEVLHIHTNTLNYRLKRIEEILSMDLTDSEQFLNLHLAVRLHQYLDANGFHR